MWSNISLRIFLMRYSHRQCHFRYVIGPYVGLAYVVALSQNLLLRANIILFSPSGQRDSCAFSRPHGPAGPSTSHPNAALSIPLNGPITVLLAYQRVKQRRDTLTRQLTESWLVTNLYIYTHLRRPRDGTVFVHSRWSICQASFRSHNMSNHLGFLLISSSVLYSCQCVLKVSCLFPRWTYRRMCGKMHLHQGFLYQFSNPFKINFITHSMNPGIQ